MPFTGSSTGVGADVQLAELTIPAAKGGLIVGDGAGAPVELTVGADETVLVADSGETSGTKWTSQTDANFIIAHEVFS